MKIEPKKSSAINSIVKLATHKTIENMQCTT